MEVKITNKRKSEESDEISDRIALDVEYLAGFIDGDGSIGSYGGRLRIAVWQSKDDGIPEVLMRLEKEYCGKVKQAGKKTETCRTRWIWSISDTKHCLYFANLISPFSIFKKSQLKLMAEFCESNRHSKEETKKFELKLKEEKSNYDIIEVKRDQLSIPYLAGLFDAEGYIGIMKDGKSIMCITKQQSMSLLLAIKDFVGHGCIIGKRSWKLGNSDQIYDLLSKLEPFLITKKDQVKLFLGTKNSRERRSIYQQLKDLKRV